ncbi:pyrroline-5-carboxylate reductase [Bacillus marinisedimentorum]|uniref:pyrroline-5-carboxylate reductase n=1 Tax=Bacillus marinisedimentorum TaxID=1821260 RepID=UPI0008734A95|nr:pyrroline-5-carboxylate reductase [Bacillus marinisedimentorum]
MDKEIGFVGCGKMAQAMIAGMINDGIVASDNITASSRTHKKLAEVKEKLGIRTTVDNLDVARTADYLFLAVPPIDYGLVIKEIKDTVKESVILITVAAGVTLQDVEKSFAGGVKVVRSMPNTPSLIGAGMSAVCANEHVTEKELEEVLGLFRSFGEAAVVAESQMDAVPAVSGSSPAYVYMMIEAMADGGVKQGLARDQAYRLAAQAVMGAAQMVLETGKHPGELKDQVCSPGGATIAAVAELEQRQFRGAVLAAMDACTKRVKELGAD